MQIMKGARRSLFGLVIIAVPVFADPGHTHLARVFTFAGVPQNQDPRREVKMLVNHGFVVGYSEDLKNPLWVAYRVCETEQPLDTERPMIFMIDERTDAKVSDGDYTSSGFHRGHMAPNSAIETRFGRLAQLETFLMSNICPQKGALNLGAWKSLETKVRNQYANDLTEVWIVAGPIFGADPERLGSGVAVPEKFYKIVVNRFGFRDSKIEMLAFIFPQAPPSGASLNGFLTSVDEIEHRTKLDFFHELPEKTEVKLESETASAVWEPPYSDPSNP
jgi:endonuclease G